MSAIKKLFGSQKFKALLYLVFGAWAFYLGRYHSLYGLGASVVFAALPMLLYSVLVVVPSGSVVESKRLSAS